jgi:hypothetical protein
MLGRGRHAFKSWDFIPTAWSVCPRYRYMSWTLWWVLRLIRSDVSILQHCKDDGRMDLSWMGPFSCSQFQLALTVPHLLSLRQTSEWSSFIQTAYITTDFSPYISTLKMESWYFSARFYGVMTQKTAIRTATSEETSKLAWRHFIKRWKR